MTPLQRAACPACLSQHGANWTQAFVARRRQNPSARFYWPDHHGEPANRSILTVLAEMSRGHCAYCDGARLGAHSRETIDHFRPKTTFPELAYAWPNLFPACDACQQAKGEEFAEPLLSPDAAEYRFERYFVFNYLTGDLEANPLASAEECLRATATLRILDLNRRQLAISRRDAWLRRQGQGDGPGSQDGTPFRFVV